ncbi:type II toxin-antitoxin system VapC family toxin [Leptolyngbya sp. DQ-M1]|uniref:type II toxin-antitoxin system VapC family toxin n=1 Tax=Leptolyngbya sp. DQ-M1 TaxID=2933920 RepID=UPI0032975734
MKALLDTHTLLWWVANNPQLSQPVREIISNPDNTIYLSVASSWEIIIKSNTGKLPLPEPSAQFIQSCLNVNRFESLAIDLTHVLQLDTLPDYHKDPFDRILLAQSQVEKMAILSADPLIARYSVQIIW